MDADFKDYDKRKVERERHKSRRSSRHRSPYQKRYASRSRSPQRSRRRIESPPKRHRSPEKSSSSDGKHKSRTRSPTRKPISQRTRSPSPFLTDFQRDLRTVVCSQLSPQLTERQLKEFFEACGKVRAAKLVLDPKTKKPKGIGYVEFRNEVDIRRAVRMTGRLLLGYPVYVEQTQAEKNLAYTGTRLIEIPDNRLYVSALPLTVTERDVGQVFEAFGRLKDVYIYKDRNRKSLGIGEVTFRNTGDARRALERMNGFELAGKQIRVGLSKEKPETQTVTEDVDEERKLSNGRKRMELMQKLAARENELVSSVKTKVDLPTRSVLLTNMCITEDAQSDDWVIELEVDVRSECKKYGRVEYVGVDRKLIGNVYVLFDKISAAQTAIKYLDGRWFGGRQISATFISDDVIGSKFPDAAYI